MMVYKIIQPEMIKDSSILLF